MPFRHVSTYISLAVVGLLLIALPVSAGETWTCPYCGQTWSFPSDHGGQLQAFAKRHREVCPARKKPPPPPPPLPPPPPPENEAQVRLQQAREFIKEINRHTETRNDTAVKVFKTESSISAAGLALFRYEQLYDMLKKELQETSNERSDFESVHRAIENVTQSYCVMTDSEYETFLGEMRVLSRAGLISGPAEHLGPPPVENVVPAREEPPRYQYTMPAVKTWYPEPTESDKEWGRKRSFWTSALPVPQSPWAKLPDVDRASAADIETLRNRNTEVQRNVSALGAALDAKEKTLQRLNAQMKTLGADVENVRGGIQKNRRAIQVLEERAGEALKEHLMAKAKGYAVKEGRKLAKKYLPRKVSRAAASLTAEARQELARFAPFIAALKRMKEYGEVMHRRFDTEGPMEKFFSGLRETASSHFDPATVRDFEHWLGQDQHAFAEELERVAEPSVVSKLMSDIQSAFPDK